MFNARHLVGDMAIKMVDIAVDARYVFHGLIICMRNEIPGRRTYWGAHENSFHNYQKTQDPWHGDKLDVGYD